MHWPVLWLQRPRKVLELIIESARQELSQRSPPRDASPNSTSTAPTGVPLTHRPPPAMSLSCRYAARSCARQLRSTSSLRTTGAVAQQRLTRRYQSTDAAAAPTNPKIATIVDQISQLTLLETADLVSSLKVRSPRETSLCGATCAGRRS